ncbi:hypothetical protein AB0I81_51480 [Nonomuraea sp. NPDC050404]|uniref:hypothetical protein n=1 Tax=Nonomuraea sp. NPDC050404 TaxID=3155783 RepID=UPI0033D9A62A
MITRPLDARPAGDAYSPLVATARSHARTAHDIAARNSAERRGRHIVAQLVQVEPGVLVQQDAGAPAPARSRCRSRRGLRGCDDYSAKGLFPLHRHDHEVAFDCPDVTPPTGHERLEPATRMG